MAEQPRWKRYRRPGEPRPEDGTPAAKKPTPKKSAPAPRNRSGLALGAAVAVVGVIALVVALVRSGDDGPDRGSVQTEVLAEDFVSAALAHATEAAPGQQPITVRLDEYGLSVEFYDPNTEKVRTVETAHYDPDGYRVRTRDNEYDDYHPGRFPLDLAQPSAMIAQVRAALDRADGPWSWRLEIEVDDASRDVVMTTDVSADEDVEQRAVLQSAPTEGGTP